VGFISKYVAGIKKGWTEEGEELGVAERKQRARERRRRNFDDPVKTLTAERDDDKKLLDEAAEEIESTQAERDEAKAELEETRTELETIKAELEETKADLAAVIEQAQSERTQFMAVLKGPGVRKLLLDTYHPDPKTARTSAAEREVLDKFTALINAAYDLIKKIDKAAAEAAAQAKDEAGTKDETEGEE
jgi:DNA repair exonuclease SbcCD ATPase subunit